MLNWVVRFVQQQILHNLDEQSVDSLSVEVLLQLRLDVDAAGSHGHWLLAGLLALWRGANTLFLQERKLGSLWRKGEGKLLSTPFSSFKIV